MKKQKPRAAKQMTPTIGFRPKSHCPNDSHCRFQTKKKGWGGTHFRVLWGIFTRYLKKKKKRNTATEVK